VTLWALLDKPGSAWSLHLTCPGWSIDDDNQAEKGDFERCTPTVLARNQDDDRFYRGACLGCGWVASPSRDSENAAAEDAHDHAWPGWRYLPTVPNRPYADSGNDKKRWTWLRKFLPLYPPGWLEAGGPVRTVRPAPCDRHVPLATPYGGYDMSAPAPLQGQQTLF
jgi:hypothetical protein